MPNSVDERTQANQIGVLSTRFPHFPISSILTIISSPLLVLSNPQILWASYGPAIFMVFQLLQEVTVSLAPFPLLIYMPHKKQGHGIATFCMLVSCG